MIEERQGGTQAANLKYRDVWGRGYVDELVLRDTFAAGSRSQWLYEQQDAS